MKHDACAQVTSSYLEHLSRDFSVSIDASRCYVLTPFSRPDGEAVEVQVERRADGWVGISDMGDTMGYLYLNGLTLSRSTIEDAHRICAGFAVTLDRNVLTVDAKSRTVGDALHRLIQAILAVTDLIQRRRPMNRVQFNDEVESLIISSGVTYDVDYSVAGQRQRHTVKFSCGLRAQPTCSPLCQLPSKAQPIRGPKGWPNRFGDIKSGSSHFRLAAVLDDRGHRAEAWLAPTLVPIREYVILWSDRDRLRELIDDAHNKPKDEYVWL